MVPSCALSIMVARTDLPFMMHTIPHLVKMSQFDFCERVLAVDTAPLSGDKVNRPGVGTMEELLDRCQQLTNERLIDRIIYFDYSPEYRERIYQKHFGAKIWQTHNWKGYPILGSIFHLEEVKGDYVLHYDSDMMLYQEAGYSWIEEGMKLMQQHPEVMSVRPLTGPPTSDGSMHQTKPYDRDPDGFYRFKFFGSRAFLIDRKRFDSLLPMPILWTSYRNKWLNALPNALKTRLNYWTHKGKLDSWELMVSKRLEETKYVRAVADSPKAWTVHPNTRAPEFLEALPDIIQQIEAGSFPPEQAGQYDLVLDAWLKFFKTQTL
ncbi:MAG: hypothetical protein J7641_20230 [Cyanobacteria bacterium SID2]|nr:hypothetical protein [Cyanobacteria bacterium SID2]MBP0003064.1 hypothetical protein [Cyanobacteria bacterium SBC]